MRKPNSYHMFGFRAAPSHLLHSRALSVMLGVLAGYGALPQACFGDLISFKKFSIKNNTGHAADDFEISIPSGNIVKFTLDQGDFQFDPTKLPATSFKLSNSVVGNGGSIGFTIGFKDYSGEDFKAFWTSDDKNIGNVLTASHSLSSTFLGGGLSSAVFALANPSPDPVSITDLAFATTAASFDMFTQDPGALSYGTPVSLTVGGGGSTNISFGSVIAGSLVVVRGTADFGDGAPDNFFAAFTTAAPEPSPAVLTGSAAAFSAGLRFVRRRRRRLAQLERAA